MSEYPHRVLVLETIVNPNVWSAMGGELPNHQAHRRCLAWLSDQQIEHETHLEDRCYFQTYIGFRSDADLTLFWMFCRDDIMEARLFNGRFAKT